MKKVQYSGRLPSYIPPDEQHRLIAQAKRHSADAASVPQASKTPPPGFAGTPSFSSSTANGAAGDAAGLVASSPDRGRQASGRQHHMPLNDLERHAVFSTCTFLLQLSQLYEQTCNPASLRHIMPWCCGSVAFLARSTGVSPLFAHLPL